MLDSKDKDTRVGDSVQTIESEYVREFVGEVVGFRDDGEIAVVEDQEGECFDLDGSEFIKV